MGDEDVYRETYRMLLLHLPRQLDRIRITDLATFLIQAQTSIDGRDEPDALGRLENSFVSAFRGASVSQEYITEDEFVRCMQDVDLRAPWDHYDVFLRRTFDRKRGKAEYILLGDYVEIVEEAFGIKLDSSIVNLIRRQVGEKIDLEAFMNMSKNPITL